MACQLDFTAAARASTPSTEAGIGRRDQRKPCWKSDCLLSSDDRHFAVFKRLAQRLQGPPIELRQLVEKEHAAMSKSRLSG